MKKQMQSGFTLIELMIVIAIIGILASIAIPQYQIYTQRTEATTAIATIRPIQLALQEYFSNNGTIPATFVATDLARFGVDDLTDFDNIGIVASVDVAAATGFITINFAATAPNDLASKTIVIEPVDSGTGILTFVINPSTAGGTSTVEDKFLPNMN